MLVAAVAKASGAPPPLQIARIAACRTALATRVDALAENVTGPTIGVEGRESVEFTQGGARRRGPCVFFGTRIGLALLPKYPTVLTKLNQFSHSV